MSELNFLKNYFKNLSNLINNEEHFDNLILTKKILCETHENDRKT